LTDSPLVTLANQVALQRHFKAKRDHVLARLKELGLDVTIPPCATFYIWLNLEKLPGPLNNGLVPYPLSIKQESH
jgi:aspartate/methionine/tyrosine aminotransferase